jgi:hypothetical protein
MTFQKGYTPWNKNMKVYIPHSGNFKKGHKLGMTGKKHSEASRKKMSESLLGRISWNQGTKSKRRIITGYVYILQPNHPACDKRGYVLESHLVIEKSIGRYIKPGEEVHHKGTKFPIDSIENRSDNSIENLQLCRNHSEHASLHMFYNPNNSKAHRQCARCKKILELNKNFYKAKERFFYLCKTCLCIKQKEYRNLRKIKTSLPPTHPAILTQ